MNSKIHPDAVKNYALVLFFVGIIFIAAYNNICGYETKQINKLSETDLGKKINVCGYIEEINKGKTTLFFKLSDENSSIDCVIFKKDQDLIDLELSQYDISLSDLEKKYYLCINGRFEKYNSDFEIIVKQINQIRTFK